MVRFSSSAVSAFLATITTSLLSVDVVFASTFSSSSSSSSSSSNHPQTAIDLDDKNNKAKISFQRKLMARRGKPQPARSLLLGPRRHLFLTKETPDDSSSSNNKKKNDMRTRRLKNSFSSHQPTECDPSAAAPEDEDSTILGILSYSASSSSSSSCRGRPFEYCQEHVDSKLGGFCMPMKLQEESLLAPPARRNLQTQQPYPISYGGTPPKPYYYYVQPLGQYMCGPNPKPYPPYSNNNPEYCDCTGFDTTTGVGSISCDFPEPICEYGCRVSTCHTMSLLYNSPPLGDDDGSSTTPRKTKTYEYCYNFVEPYSQTFCKTYYRQVGAKKNYGGVCSITVDGEECPYCFQDENGCVSFDCQDLGAGNNTSCSPPPSYYGTEEGEETGDDAANGGSYAYPYYYYSRPRAPIVLRCNDVIPIIGNCTVCPEDDTGRQMAVTSNTNMTNISFPFIGQDLTCGYVASLADQGLIYGPACDYVKDHFVKSSCCE